jgi:hypothetical protein
VTNANQTLSMFRKIGMGIRSVTFTWLQSIWILHLLLLDNEQGAHQSDGGSIFLDIRYLGHRIFGEGESYTWNKMERTICPIHSFCNINIFHADN